LHSIIFTVLLFISTIGSGTVFFVCLGALMLNAYVFKVLSSWQIGSHVTIKCPSLAAFDSVFVLFQFA
jgi:hypothetical protein